MGHVGWDRIGAALCISCGVVLVLLALADVFYTVLFPGSGHGPVRRPLARAVRGTFRTTRRLRPGLRRQVLAYAGPTEVTVTLLSWFVLLLVGWAAIYLPALGGPVRAASGPTDTSWGTALYFSGYNLTTLGLGDLVAASPAYRMLVVAESASGFMTFTLAISYFISVYATVTGRNTFALALHDRSRGTGRGAAIVRALWAEGPVASALHLDSTASDLRELVQTHTSYPVLRSFHYQHEYDALPRMLLTCWETVTLLQTSVDAGSAGRPELTGSALTEIEAAAATMTQRLTDAGQDEQEAAPWQRDQWRRHHCDMLAELSAAGVPIRPDASERYLAARARWDLALARLADEVLYDWPDGLRPAPSPG